MLILACLLIFMGIFVPAFAAPIHDAAERGDLRIVEQIVRTDHSALSQRDSSGYTALNVAVVNQHLAVAKYLLRSGCDVNNVVTAYGYTPLEEATINGDVSMARLLISYGAKADHNDKYGHDAFYWADKHGKDFGLDIVHLVDDEQNKQTYSPGLKKFHSIALRSGYEKYISSISISEDGVTVHLTKATAYMDKTRLKKLADQMMSDWQDKCSKDQDIGGLIVFDSNKNGVDIPADE